MPPTTAVTIAATVALMIVVLRLPASFAIGPPMPEAPMEF
jgi:hypothetical protein